MVNVVFSTAAAVVCKQTSADPKHPPTYLTLNPPIALARVISSYHILLIKLASLNPLSLLPKPIKKRDIVKESLQNKKCHKGNSAVCCR